MLVTYIVDPSRTEVYVTNTDDTAVDTSVRVCGESVEVTKMVDPSRMDVKVTSSVDAGGTESSVVVRVGAVITTVLVSAGSCVVSVGPKSEVVSVRS